MLYHFVFLVIYIPLSFNWLHDLWLFFPDNLVGFMVLFYLVSMILFGEFISPEINNHC